MRSRSAVVERRKPCGLEVHCPLVDEHRFFAEASSTFWKAGLSSEQVSKLVPLAIGKWCKALEARQVRPRLPECRQVMAEAAEAWRQGSGARRQAFAALLDRQAKARHPEPLTYDEIAQVFARELGPLTEDPAE